MRPSYLTFMACAVFLGFSSVSTAQIDIGITDLKIITPNDLNTSKVLELGDTITKIEFKLFNFSSQSISGSDFANDEVKVSASYNGDFKITNIFLVGSISSNSGRIQNFPENFSSYNPFPAFPTGTGDVELCVYTQYSGDADISNDTACFNFKVVDGNATVAVTEVGILAEEPSYHQSGNNVIVTASEPIELVRLIDITGKEHVLSTSENSERQVIDVASLPAGLYVLSYKPLNGSMDHFRMWVE